MITINRTTSLIRKSGAIRSYNALIGNQGSSGIPTLIQDPHNANAELRNVVVKDNICTTSFPTTCASAVLQGFYSPFAATVVENLQSSGINIMGKSNMDEFGMGSDSIHSIHGPVVSIFQRGGDVLSAGGSSGGSAVAVASHNCHEALGTDTGGSVRLPAAYTGLVGFKPSYGLISRRGVVAYANSLDTVGIIAPDSCKAREIFGVLKGHDVRDPTSIALDHHDKRTMRNPYNPKSLRIGVPLEYNISELQPIIRKTWINTLQRLQEQGHSIHTVSLPTTKIAISAYYVIATAEASSNLAKYDGVRYGRSASVSLRGTGGQFTGKRGDELGEEVKRRILLGSYSLSAAAFQNYFIKAQQVRRLVQQDFNRIFNREHPLLRKGEQGLSSEDQRVDVIITPTAQSLPPKLTDIAYRDPISAYATDVLTIPASLAGLPAISIPVPFDMPEEWDEQDVRAVGIQVIAQYGDDQLVLDAAEAIEGSVSSRTSNP